MKDYSDVIERARRFAADVLPEPALLAPETAADFVAWVESEAAKIGQTLGDLSEDDLVVAGGLDAWRALIIRCVDERVGEP